MYYFIFTPPPLLDREIFMYSYTRIDYIISSRSVHDTCFRCTSRNLFAHGERVQLILSDVRDDRLTFDDININIYLYIQRTESEWTPLYLQRKRVHVFSHATMLQRLPPTVRRSRRTRTSGITVVRRCSFYRSRGKRE